MPPTKSHRSLPGGISLLEQSSLSCLSGSPSQGVDGLTVPGYTGAIGGESSPIPCGGELRSAPTATENTEDTKALNLFAELRQYYLELEATSPSTLSLSANLHSGKMCGCYALLGEDEDGSRIVKRIACGREWCCYCREISHRRRIARCLPHLMQILPMAYDVITFPLEIRPLLRNPQTLALIGRKTRKLYRQLGYNKLYTRWHFFGDKSPIFNPHLNVLYDGRWLSEPEFTAFKDLIRRKLLPRALFKLIKKDLVIHHQYAKSPKKITHWIKYITRATFLEKGWNEPLAEALFGFHNGCFAGSWDAPSRWRLTGTDKKYNPLLKLAQNLHPVSGKPLIWTRKPIPWALILMEDPVDIGGGWYLLPPIRSPPERGCEQ